VGRSGPICVRKKSQEFQIKILYPNPSLKHPPPRIPIGGVRGCRNLAWKAPPRPEGPAGVHVRAPGQPELERGAAGKKGGPETARQLVEGEGTIDHQAISNHLISMPAFQDAA
jgi:hypothetical protein